jgi:hypothetical protein
MLTEPSTSLQQARNNLLMANNDAQFIGMCFSPDHIVPPNLVISFRIVPIISV